MWCVVVMLCSSYLSSFGIIIDRYPPDKKQVVTPNTNPWSRSPGSAFSFCYAMNYIPLP